MTKLLSLASLFALLAAPVHAASVKLTPEQSLELVERLLLAGVKADTSKAVYKLAVADLNCEIRYVSHAEEPANLLWGMATYECAKPAGKGAKAKLLVSALDAIEETYRDKITIKDCSMGRCYDTLKKISCTIDSREAYTEKRFACELTDTQE